jgi:hypothetical protein
MVKRYGPEHPHRPVYFCGKPLVDATREELLAMLTFLNEQNIHNQEAAASANIDFFRLAADRGPSRGRARLFGRGFFAHGRHR